MELINLNSSLEEWNAYIDFLFILVKLDLMTYVEWVNEAL